MNIKRFKWPAFIVAGLHGVLLVSYPRPATGNIIRPGAPRPFRPIPQDPIVQVEKAESENTETTRPERGGPAAAELPDTLPRLAEHPPFTIPVDDSRMVKVTGTITVAPTGPGDGHELGGPGSPILVVAARLDRIPRATVQISPDYPPALRAQGIAGSATIEFDVGVDGRVIRAVAVSHTRREFSDAAVRAVLKWRFEPGKRHGQAVPFRMAVPVDFNLGID
jgi:protein TonB